MRSFRNLFSLLVAAVIGAGLVTPALAERLDPRGQAGPRAAGIRPLERSRVGSTKRIDRIQGPGLNVSPATVNQVIQCLLGPGIAVSNVTYQGSPSALGTFTGGASIIGFDSGVILSSGLAASVVGPNQNDATTGVNGAPGDPCLDALIPGFVTADAAVLEFDFNCGTTSDLTIQYVFGSEEYNEYVNSSYNDVFGFFLDGCGPANNLARVPATCNTPGVPVTINNVNCGNPFVGAGSNCDCFRNNDLTDGGGAIDTELDGLTQVFGRTVTITPGLHHLKIAIADAGDDVLDSDVFLSCHGLACVCPDLVPPSGVELHGACKLVGPDRCVNLSWLAPSDTTAIQDPDTHECVPAIQAAAACDIRWSSSPIVTQADFNAATQVAGEPLPAPPGTPEAFSFCGLPSGDVYVALQSRDASFNVSPISSVHVVCEEGGCTSLFLPHTDYPTGVFPTAVAIEDLNGDLKPDLAVVDRYAPAVSVLLNTGAGVFGPKTDFATAAGPTWIAIADLNSDTRPDLATADQDADVVSVLLGNGDGTFGASNQFTTQDAPTSLVLEDLNGDGKPDAAVANQISGSVSVLFGNGAGGFGPKADFPAAGGAFSVAAADLDGSNGPDLAVADVYDNLVSVLPANGDGTYATSTDYATGNAPFSVAIADLNADGKRDLVVSNEGSASVSVFLGIGGGTFGPRTDFPTGNGPAAVRVNDFDGDGKFDLATSNYDDNTVSVLLGDGTGAFGPKIDFATGPTPQSLAVRDLNGDGTPDIATVNYTDNTVSVLLSCQGRVDVPSDGPLAGYTLGRVTPNPSQGAIHVPFALARQTPVRIRVLDVLGRTVSVLADGVLPAGRHEVSWNGMRGDAPAPAGIYFVCFQGGGTASVKRVVMAR